MLSWMSDFYQRRRREKAWLNSQGREMSITQSLIFKPAWWRKCQKRLASQLLAMQSLIRGWPTGGMRRGGGAPDPEWGNLLLLTLGTSPLLAGLGFFHRCNEGYSKVWKQNSQICELERITYFIELLNRIWTLLISLLKNISLVCPPPPPPWVTAIHNTA